MEIDIDDKFRKILNNWIDINWSDTEKKLANKLKVSPQHLSNIRRGTRSCGEKTRQKICKGISVDYKSLFDTIGPNKIPEPSTVIPFPDARLEAMHKNLDAIYKSGDVGLIKAIESNLIEFRKSVEKEKKLAALENGEKNNPSKNANTAPENFAA